jgi:hypothetical protein
MCLTTCIWTCETRFASHRHFHLYLQIAHGKSSRTIIWKRAGGIGCRGTEKICELRTHLSDFFEHWSCVSGWNAFPDDLLFQNQSPPLPPSADAHTSYWSNNPCDRVAARGAILSLPLPLWLVSITNNILCILHQWYYVNHVLINCFTSTSSQTVCTLQ